MSDSDIYNYGKKIEKTLPNIFDQNNFLAPYKLEIHLPPKTKKLCWLNCPHCYTQEELADEEKISGKRLIEIINEVSWGSPKNGAVPEQIIFSGFRTDPLNSDVFDEVIYFSKLKEFGVGVHSKGLILKNETINVLNSKNNDGDYVTFSVDAGNNRTYNAIHGVNKKANLYYRVVENINNLVSKRNSKDSKLKIRATYLLTNRNCDNQIFDFVKTFSEIGVDTIRFSLPIFPTMGKQNRNSIYEIISKKNLDSFKIKIKELAEEFEEVIYLDFDSEQKKFLPCYTRYIFPSIGYDGYLYPCCLTSSNEFKNLRIADLKKENFWDSYFKQEKLDYCKANCQCDRNSREVNKTLSNILNQNKDFNQD